MMVIVNLRSLTKKFTHENSQLHHDSYRMDYNYCGPDGSTGFRLLAYALRAYRYPRADPHAISSSSRPIWVDNSI